MQCNAVTREGRGCHNLARDESRFCFVHRKHREPFSLGRETTAILGAIVGSMVVPGIGGAFLGGVLGGAIGNGKEEYAMQKKKVFVSFDFDNDKTLKDFIIGQSRLPDSPFEIVDHSLKEAAPEHNWEKKAENAIARSQLVIVMVGQYTHRASGVLKEVRMARKLGRPIVQVIGYKNGNYTAVPDAGRLYSWNWENLKKLLA